MHGSEGLPENFATRLTSFHFQNDQSGQPGLTIVKSTTIYDILKRVTDILISCAEVIITLSRTMTPAQLVKISITTTNSPIHEKTTLTHPNDDIEYSKNRDTDPP